jgi:hypothetical protein
MMPKFRSFLVVPEYLSICSQKRFKLEQLKSPCTREINNHVVCSDEGHGQIKNEEEKDFSKL